MSTIQHLVSVPFDEISSIPKLIKDFLRGDLQRFEDAHFSNSGVKTKIDKKQSYYSQEKREVLVDVLKDQFKGLELSEIQKTNIELLKNSNTTTVVTGHQLNLFSGPAFFIYKIMQTIKLAKELSTTKNPIVPVFWMATEDHDFEEINHFKTEDSYYEIFGKSGGAVGRIGIEDDFFVDKFEKDFKDFVFGTELILMLKKAYQKGNTLAQATRILVQELFSSYGLLILDGDDARLKAFMKPLFKKELIEQTLEKSSKNDIEFLKEKYGKVQVNPREINLFYLSQTRNRIEKIGDNFHIVDTDIVFSQEELLTELENFPERFSPNAVLRPMYQETILPNIAYVGGNAEIMYWLELQDYFKAVETPFPFLIPRNSILFLKEKTISKIEKFNLSINDFLSDFPSLEKKVLLENSALLNEINTKEIVLRDNFSSLAKKAEETDKTFLNLVNAEEKRQLKSYDKMRKRLLRAEKKKEQEKLERLENLFLAVHPSRVWQERVYNFSVFYADFGREWLEACYHDLDIEKSELIILSV